MPYFRQLISKALVYVFLILSTTARAEDFPTSEFDILGAKIGDSINLKTSQFPGITCTSLAFGVEQCINPSVTIENTDARLMVVYLDGRIAGITYKFKGQNTRDLIEKSLLKKYGMPTLRPAEYMGLVYDTESFWIENNGVELVSKKSMKVKNQYEVTLFHPVFFRKNVINNRIK
jgi:hypothetical protein